MYSDGECGRVPHGMAICGIMNPIGEWSWRSRINSNSRRNGNNIVSDDNTRKCVDADINGYVVSGSTLQRIIGVLSCARC